MTEFTNQLPVRHKLSHTVPPWVGDCAVYFITICCEKRGVNRLNNDQVASAIFESVEFRQTRGDWFVRLMLLMPDHLHALISFPHDRDMKAVLSGWKSITAKTAQVHWQRDFFDHRLRSGDSNQEKASYIRHNPVRKGLVMSPADWKFIWEPKPTADSASPPYLLT